MEDLIVNYCLVLVQVFPTLIFLRIIFDLFRNLIFDTNTSARG